MHSCPSMVDKWKARSEYLDSSVQGQPEYPLWQLSEAVSGGLAWSLSWALTNPSLREVAKKCLFITGAGNIVCDTDVLHSQDLLLCEWLNTTIRQKFPWLLIKAIFAKPNAAKRRLLLTPVHNVAYVYFETSRCLGTVLRSFGVELTQSQYRT